MASFDIIMPKMGESIEEATITNWFVKEGDQVEEEDILLEIATDKVDSEIPSPVDGVVKKILFAQDEVVAVGTVIAVIDMDGEPSTEDSEEPSGEETKPDAEPSVDAEPEKDDQPVSSPGDNISSSSERFYSPLVKKIAREENITQEKLDRMEGSGLNGRVQKNDILRYLDQRQGAGGKEEILDTEPQKERPKKEQPAPATTSGENKRATTDSGDEVVEMSRMRKLIAGHMTRSKQTSAHVTNMLEVDVTNVVNWRNRVKEDFLKREGVKLTYLPVFLEATVKALKEFPQINASVEGDRIILKRRINLGVAVSLPGYNLIVPNIKDADTLNLSGLTRKMNELADAARSNKLNPDDISGGTFTVTNFGSFQNDIGTPIINQPEVAILAVGAIKKKTAVIETREGDMIGIRQKMWLSLTYDHRIIDGALGGAFLKRLSDYLESFDPHSGTFKL